MLVPFLVPPANMALGRGAMDSLDGVERACISVAVLGFLVLVASVTAFLLA